MPDDLLYYSSTVYDELVVDYETQRCYVIKRTSYNASGGVARNSSEVIKNYPYPETVLTNGNYIISIPNQTNAYLFVALALQSAYTDIFATKVQLNSSIEQTEDKIELSVSQLTTEFDKEVQNLSSQITQTAQEISTRVSKVDGGKELSSLIRQTAELIYFSANNFGWDSSYSSMSTNGKLNCKNIDINGGTIVLEDDGSNTINAKLMVNGKLGSSIFQSQLQSDEISFSVDSDSSSLSASALDINSSYGFISLSPNGLETGPYRGSSKTVQINSDGSIFCEELNVTGQKHRIVGIDNGNKVLINAYETATPYFGDIGSGRTDENGYCEIFIEDIFSQTIEIDTYKVFIQECGNGHLYVNKHKNYFEVIGTPNLEFDWELKAIQKGYKNIRLEKYDIINKGVIR